MNSRAPISQAKARFAEMVRRVERGETLILTRHGRPVARLAPLAERAGERSVAGPPAGEVQEAAPPYGARARGRPEPHTREGRRRLLERELEETIWPRIPDDQLGAAIEKREREEILGYGSDGV